MKKILFFLPTMFLAFAPAITFAHGGMMDFGSNSASFTMMEQLEDRAMGDETHEEMENLMAKMMTGNLSEAEAQRMVALMNEYPGPYGMMMNRMMGTGGNWGTMSWGNSGGFNYSWAWLFWATMLVWLAVGILLIIWLIKKIQGK